MGFFKVDKPEVPVTKKEYPKETKTISCGLTTERVYYFAPDRFIRAKRRMESHTNDGTTVLGYGNIWDVSIQSGTDWIPETRYDYRGSFLRTTYEIPRVVSLHDLDPDGLRTLIEFLNSLYT